MFCLFLTFRHADAAVAVSPEDRRAIADILRAVPGIERALLLTPAVASDRYYDDGPAPMLAMQVYASRLEVLEAAIAADGALARIDAAHFPVLREAEGDHQVMWARPFPVPPRDAPAGSTRCAFMVHYHGAPQDPNAWHDFYLRHHPAIMADFPAIREIEVCTPVEWIDGLSWPRAHHFQRNKVVFDDAGALEAALNSPTRERMKEDRDKFPPMSGGSVHQPMTAETILGRTDGTQSTF